MTTLDDLLYPDDTEPQRQVRPHEEGVIISVSGDGARFTLDGFPSTTGFGPAPFVQGATDPAPGDTCLVGFAGPGISRPWVLAWWSA